MAAIADLHRFRVFFLDVISPLLAGNGRPQTLK